MRRYTGWSYDQVRVHLERLVEMEYVLVHHGRRGQSFVYELLYDGEGQEGNPFLLGLIDVDRLRQTTAESIDYDAGRGRKFGGSKSKFGG